MRWHCKKDIADELGIGSEVIVAAGAGDNAAAAVGTGTVGDGHCNVSLGTSGTIFISSKEFEWIPTMHFILSHMQMGNIILWVVY